MTTESREVHVTRYIPVKSCVYIVTITRNVGTNTYLVGQRRPYLLIDTGEGKESYTPLLETALKHLSGSSSSESESSQLISDIILTHKHHDHVNGLPFVLRLLRELWDRSGGEQSGSTYKPPRLHKFPLPASSPDTELPKLLKNLVPSLYVIPPLTDAGETPLEPALYPLAHGQKIQTLDKSTTLQVLHTPGHTADSIFLYLEEENALFSADSVLGQGTAVFEDLGTYIRSLKFILEVELLGKKSGFGVLYPGHGPTIEDGPAMIKKYIKHRQEREDQVIAVLKSKDQSASEGGNGTSSESSSESRYQAWPVSEIVKIVYKDYPSYLWLAAMPGIQMHLTKLKEENKVKHIQADGVESKWQLLDELAGNSNL